MRRREFLTGSAAGTLLGCMPKALKAQAANTGPQRLTVNLSSAGTAVGTEFTGLSYEKAQLAHPGYFSAENHELVGLVKRLGKRGVLRIGGNTSDFSMWSRQETRVAIDEASAPVGPDAGLNIDKTTQVTPTSVDKLRTFLDATGWSVIYGLDLGHGSPEAAADEAAYAVERLGSALAVLQIGNEPDLFYRNGMRSPSYKYSDYIKEWTLSADAVRKRTPSAPLGGPDVGNHLDWVDSFAHDVPYAKLLTSHFYAEGPPSDPNANIARLLRPHPKNESNMKRLVALGAQARVPYRMCEGNSCYHGGKEGVSDSFASALWGANYMLSLAKWGVSGVNLHGGGQGFYTPIAGGSAAQPFVARPLYYGMLMAQEALTGRLLDVEGGSESLYAYASLDVSNRLSLAVLNLSPDLEADLSIGLEGTYEARRLTAPSLESTTGVRFGASTVESNGAWHRMAEEVVKAQRTGLKLHACPKGLRYFAAQPKGPPCVMEAQVYGSLYARW